MFPDKSNEEEKMSPLKQRRLEAKKKLGLFRKDPKLVPKHAVDMTKLSPGQRSRLSGRGDF